MLSSLLTLSQGPERSGVSGYRGAFYHFLDENGLRKGEAEISNIDMALLSCGALTCRGYFDRDGESDIRDMARRLFARIDWRLTLCDNGQFSHGWKPELPGGLLDLKWDCYTGESYLICLLAVAGNVGKEKSKQVPADTFWRWDRIRVKAPNGTEFIATCPGSMFCHTFASMWLPPHELDRPDLHPTQPVNWWQNTKDYARANYEYCQAHRELYGKHAWGLTACEGRLGTLTIYKSYGSPPVFGVRRPGDYFQLDTPQPVWWPRGPGKMPLLVEDNTVMAVYGAAGAISFLPEEAIRALRHYRRNTDLWQSADCGFGDAYAKTAGYANHAVFAIDAGPMLIAIDNYRALRRGDRGVVWRSFVANPEIQHALDAIYGPRAETQYRPTSLPIILPEGKDLGTSDSRAANTLADAERAELSAATAKDDVEKRLAESAEMAGRNDPTDQTNAAVEGQGATAKLQRRIGPLKKLPVPR